MFRIKLFNTRKKRVISAGIFLLLGYYWFWLPDKLFDDPCSTAVYTHSNELLAAQIADDGQWRFPESDSIPFKIEKCLLEFEDRYFYYHPGVNAWSLLKAVKKNISNKRIVSGGSTLTMQLARMMRKNQSRTYWNKLIEILLAVRIELSYSKKSILKKYISHAPFGGNVVGLEAASWKYFSKNTNNLSWAEAALIAVLPNAPSLIHPGKNTTVLLEKRNRLLKKLYDKKVISKENYVLACAEELPPSSSFSKQQYNHFLQKTIKDGYKGKKVVTTIDISIQKNAEFLLNDHLRKIESNGIHNAAMLVIDNKTGAILSYVGNVQEGDKSRSAYVDVVTAPRSTGSILKPFLFAFMLDDSKLFPHSFVEDVPTQIGSYAPKNFNLNFAGLIPASEALQRSLNVPAVKMLQEYGVEKFHFNMKKLGVKSFRKPAAHYGLSIILGGGEASLWEIATAYSAMARVLINFKLYNSKYSEGDFHDITYTKSNNDVVPVYSKNAFVSAGAIWNTFEVLTDLKRPDEYSNWAVFSSTKKIAWKTGTSFGFRDAWAVGVNKKYTVAVWVGNATGEGRPNLTGVIAAAPLMFNMFNKLPESTWFEKVLEDMAAKKTCAVTGFKASANCETTKMQWVPKKASNFKLCHYHAMLKFDETGRFLVNSDCYPVSKMKNRSCMILNPVQAYYYAKRNPMFIASYPELEGCSNISAGKQMDIVYPSGNIKIYIPVDETGNKSRLVLRVAHKNRDAHVYWHINGSYYAETSIYHEVEFVAEKGIYNLEVVDSFGEVKKCCFEIIDKQRSLN